jgi:hypothetical protein
MLFDAARAPKTRAVEEKNCHIECRFGALEHNIMMWRVINGLPSPEPFVPMKTGVPKDKLRVRVVFIELRPDFNLSAHRFLLQQPPFDKKKPPIETIRNYVKAWQDLIASEKENQYKALLTADVGFIMPPLPAAWGEVDHLCKMPCIIWIRLLGERDM